MKVVNDMNNKGSVGIIIIVLIILAVLVWGFIGGNEAKSIGVTCDTGAGESLCWKWHKNVIGQAEEITGNVIERVSEMIPQNAENNEIDCSVNGNADCPRGMICCGGEWICKTACK